MTMPRNRLWISAAACVIASILATMPFSGFAAPAGMPAASQPGEHERHPEIHRAIRHLEETKHELEKAAHEYQGHRAAALKATEEALKECHEALGDDHK